MSFQEILTQLTQNFPSVVDRRLDVESNTDSELEEVFKEFGQRALEHEPAVATRLVQQRVAEIAQGPKTVPARFRGQMEEYQHSFLGVGYLRFAGLNNVWSSVRVSRDLDTRVNPRAMNRSHVESLKKSIEKKKEDHLHPIILKVDPSLIDPALLERLGATKPFQQYERLELFQLNNITPEEQQLDYKVFWGRSAEPPFAYLTSDEQSTKKQRLHSLRAGRPLAEFVNGSHRADTMVELAQAFDTSRRAVIEQGKKVEENPDDVGLQQEYLKAVNELVIEANTHTWQVLIFRDSTSPALLNELATNTDPLPSLPAGESEQMWMFATQVQADLDMIKRNHPEMSRGELFDQWRANTSQQQDSKQAQDARQVRAVSPEEDEPTLVPRSANKKRSQQKDTFTGLSVSASKSKTRGASAGEETYKRLATVPLTLEMLLANKSCLWPLTQMLSHTTVTTLLQPTSGGFIGNFWLSMELLQWLTNVSGGEGFRQAQQLLADSPIITAGGYAAAIPAWKEMHKEPQRLPEALKCYGQDQATLFVKFYNKSFPLDKKHDDDYLSRDWFDPEVHLEVRKVFENFGLALDDHDLECFRRMGLAARMYARLPSWDPKSGVEDDEEGLGIHHDNYFYCRAALPARPIAAQWSRVSSLISTTGAGVEFLEYLLDRCKPMWTQNTESLRANWYHTNRGTQQVVADWLAPGNYPDGYIASRLNKASAIQWIENPFTYLALRYVDKAVDPKHRLSKLRLDYGAGRTDGLKALKPEKLDEIRIFKEGVPKTGCANVGELAQTLKEFAKTSLIPFIRDGQAQDLEALLEANPCTRIISPVFWRTVQPISYATSWSIADHNQIIPGTIIGWGLALDAYHTLVVDHLLYHRCVYWLFDLAKVSSEDRGCWYDDAYNKLFLRRCRRRLVKGTKDSVPSDTENETDSDWDATAEMEPITGIGDPTLHVTQPGTRGRVPPSSLISIPPSHTTDHRRFLGRKKRAKKPRLSQKPQKTLQDSSTVAHCSQGPHTRSSRRIASGSISDQGSSAQVPSPLQEDAHEDILSNNPPPSPGLPQHAMDTEQPRDTQEPSHSLLWPNQSPSYPSAWSVSAIQSPHARSPQLASVSATNSGNLLPSNKPSPFTSSVPENAHVLVGATQSSVAETDTPIDVIGCWAVWETDGTRRWNEKQFTFDHLDSEAVARAFPNWQLTENQEEIMREMSVSGILVNGFLSSRLFPGLDGQLFFGPVRQRADVVRKADKAKTRTLMALDGIHHLRRRMLNDLLVNIPRLVCESTYPSSYVHDNLAVHIYHTKLSYLKMVAASIHKAQIPPDDAWAEAVFLAVSDKVFANEGFEWRESGELVMDVSWVFAGGVTNHPNAGKVVVLIVPHPAAPLDRLWSTYDRYLATAVAQGPSLSAAMSHAIMAGPVQALQTYGFVEGRVIRPNGPVSTAALPVIDNVDFDQGPQFRRVVYSRRTGYPSEEEHSVAFDYGMRQVEVKTLPRTLQSLRSCFSDGRFLRELPWMFLSYSGKGSSEPELLPHFYRAEQELLKKRTELSSALEKYYSELVFSLAKPKVAASWDSICGDGADSHTTNLVLVPDSITGPTASTPVATHLLPPNTSDQVDQILPKMNLAGLAATNAVSPLGFRRPTTETGRFQNTDRRFSVPSRTLSPPTIHAGQSQRHTSGVGPSSLLWSTSLRSMLTRSPPPASQVIIEDNQRNKRKLTISSSSPTEGKTRRRLDDCNYDDDDDGDGDDEAFN